MKRVFYFSGFTLTVFQWHKNHFINSYVFNPSKDGLDDFARYLKASRNGPARILVDVIEEDFRQENIPHVNLNDRKVVIKRLIERHYRKSVDYVYHKVRGRERSGRRDDKLFYGVLTNPEILEPWLKVIAETGTEVAGIWSLPLISESVVDLLDKRQGNVLLVSQQVPSNLRQSFFKDGTFEISRSAVVNLDEANIGEYIAEEVEQTSRFLSNQRHIGFDDKLTIHVVCNEDDIEIIKRHCVDTPLREYVYHDLDELHEKVGCSDIKEPYCSGLYSYIARKLSFWKKHYGPSYVFRFYYQRLIRNALKMGSALIVMFSLLIALVLYAESKISMNEAAVIVKQSKQLEYKYVQELERYESELIRAQVMKSSVLLAEKINLDKAISPQNFLISMSRLLSDVDMQHIRVTSVEWKRTQLGEAVFEGKKQRKSPKRAAASKNTYQHYAIIVGDVVTDNSFKKAVTEVSNFIKLLKSNELIQKAEILKIPFDVRPESSFENEHSANDSTKAGSNRNSFEIRVLLKADDHV